MILMPPRLKLVVMWSILFKLSVKYLLLGISLKEKDKNGTHILFKRIVFINFFDHLHPYSKNKKAFFKTQFNGCSRGS